MAPIVEPMERSKSTSARRLPGLGDRVRFRDACVAASGIIVDELTKSYVRVKWDQVAVPSVHRREDLQLDDPSEPRAH